MKSRDYIVVLVTASSAQEADRIASVLLENKVAACVNITHRPDTVTVLVGR